MSTAAIPVHVALVNESSQDIDLQGLAGALSEQILHDFAPVWRVSASVGAYSKAPAGTWAVIAKDRLDQPGALGYHTDEHNQPIAYVEAGDGVTVTFSHEILEMLADPWGNRTHGARLPEGLELDYRDFGLKHESSHVSYLLEACDPCEATSYDVGGVVLSDFLLPAWYRTSPGAAAAYSFRGGCSAPRQVADGGYVSFGTPPGEWFQVFDQGGQLSVQDIGRFNRAEFGSLREFSDHHAREFRADKR